MTYPIGLEEARADAGIARESLARMVDDFARLPPPEFRAKYGCKTLGEGWDRIVARAREIATNEEVVS